MSDQVFNYDPNETRSFSNVQIVRLVFGLWDYRYTVDVEIGGNTSGLSVIESATNHAHTLLCDAADDPDRAELVMTRANGDTLICTDDEDQGEEWMANMLISAEIIAFKTKAKDQ